jgi:hypothetical protein
VSGDARATNSTRAERFTLEPTSLVCAVDARVIAAAVGLDCPPAFAPHAKGANGGMVGEVERGDRRV